PDQFGGAASALSGEDTDLLGSNENAPGSVGPARRRLMRSLMGAATALSTLRSEPPSPAAPTPPIPTPAAPPAPTARLGHGTYFGRGLTDGCDVRRRRYGRCRANERKPSCNDSSNHD